MPFVLFASNDSVQESFGYTPFELVFGHEVRGPLKLVKEKWVRTEDHEDVITHISHLKEKLTKAVASANEHFGEAKRRMNLWYDKRARDIKKGHWMERFRVN